MKEQQRRSSGGGAGEEEQGRSSGRGGAGEKEEQGSGELEIRQLISGEKLRNAIKSENKTVFNASDLKNKG